MKSQIIKKKSQKLKFHSLKYLFLYLKPKWKQFFSASFLMIILSLLALPTPYLMKYIIDEVLIAKNIKLLNLIILLLIAIQLLKLIFSFLTNYLFSVFNQEIIVKIKKDLFHWLLRLPLSFFDKTQKDTYFQESEKLKDWVFSSQIHLSEF